MLFLVPVALFVVTHLLVVPALLVVILSKRLFDSCFQTVKSRLLFLSLCQMTHGDGPVSDLDLTQDLIVNSPFF